MSSNYSFAGSTGTMFFSQVFLFSALVSPPLVPPPIYTGTVRAQAEDISRTWHLEHVWKFVFRDKGGFLTRLLARLLTRILARVFDWGFWPSKNKKHSFAASTVLKVLRQSTGTIFLSGGFLIFRPCLLPPPIYTQVKSLHKRRTSPGPDIFWPELWQCFD